MKPTFISVIESRLARHDLGAENRRVWPVPDHFFRPGRGTPLGHAQTPAGDRARRAFRRMTTEMLIKYERDEPIEVALYLLVTTVALWPLVDLLVTLVQTANG